MKFIAIIPARYGSTRFPGKPLAMLGGRPVIQRVYEQVAGVLDDAVVATDDERIYDTVLAFGGSASIRRRMSASADCGLRRCTRSTPSESRIRIDSASDAANDVSVMTMIRIILRTRRV